MDRKLRHHIIEGLVIVALIAIFGPMLFAPAGSQNYIKPVDPPAFPDKVNYDKSMATLEEETSPLAEQKEPLPIEKPDAWVVQLGSFTVRENAERLLKQLRSYNMRVFTYTQEENGESVTRIYVGPVATHASADEILGQVESELKVQGIIVHFNPLEL